MHEPEGKPRPRLFEQYMRFLATSVSQEDPRSLPLRVVVVASKVLTHPVHAALILQRPDRGPVCLAASDELAGSVDALQCRLGQGPSLHPDPGSVPVVVEDLLADARWPTFGPVCANETGMRSMLVVRLPLGGGEQGALSFFTGKVDAFGADDARVAVAMTPYAALAVEASMRADDRRTLLATLHDSPQVSTAVGIVMSRYALGEAAAQSLLRRSSLDRGVTLHELAEEVSRTGRLPA